MYMARAFPGEDYWPEGIAISPLLQTASLISTQGSCSFFGNRRTSRVRSTAKCPEKGRIGGRSRDVLVGILCWFDYDRQI